MIDFCTRKYVFYDQLLTPLYALELSKELVYDFYVQNLKRFRPLCLILLSLYVVQFLWWLCGGPYTNWLSYNVLNWYWLRLYAVRQLIKSLDNFLQVNQTWGLWDDNARMLIKSLCVQTHRVFVHSHCIYKVSAKACTKVKLLFYGKSCKSVFLT